VGALARKRAWSCITDNVPAVITKVAPDRPPYDRLRSGSFGPGVGRAGAVRSVRGSRLTASLRNGTVVSALGNRYGRPENDFGSEKMVGSMPIGSCGGQPAIAVFLQLIFSPKAVGDSLALLA